jgi:hypothetical protein
MGRPIVLNDPHLDERDPHTRMFLLCEHWRNRTDEARDLIRRLVDAIDGNGAVGDSLQRLRDEADMWLATQATAGSTASAKLVTHCPWCSAPVSVADEPYCANDDCRWNNGGTAPAAVSQEKP